MRRSIAPIFVCSLLVFLVVGLMGCGGDDPAGPTPDPGPDWPENETALPAADAAALADASDRWEILRQGKDLVDARTALVTDLNDAWPEVESAEITTDGYTIFVRFIDGATSFLVTNEYFTHEEEMRYERGSGPDTRATQPRPLTALARRSGCEDALIPPARKVHIVNAWSGIDASSQYTVNALRDFFETAGWDPNDIDVTTRDGLDDASFTPESLFEQWDYGVVIFVANGTIQYDAQGEEHYYMECFTGGRHETYAETVDLGTWQEYVGWYQNGELIRGDIWSEDQQEMVSEILIRDDRLADEMFMQDGTMVGFVSPYSSGIQDEMLDAGAGCVMGWDGNLSPVHNSIAFMMMGQSVVEESGTSAIDMASLLASAQEDGHGFSFDEFGNQTAMTMATGGGDYYLPANLDFEFPDECQPAGVDYYEVQIHYPGCPEHDASTWLSPGSIDPEWNLWDGLLPADAEIYFEAKDWDDQVLETGLWNLDLTSGTNPIELCPCDAELDLNLTDYPQDGPYAASYIQYEAYYGADGMPANIVDLDVSAQEWTGLDAGQDVIILATAFNEDGVAVGYEWGDQDLRCGRAPWDFCFGWISVSAGNYPSETAQIVVTVPGDEDVVPASVSFAPGEEAALFGCFNGAYYNLEAEAFNSLGSSLGTTTNQVTVGCGATEIALNFAVYGIILEADPRHVAANGMETVTVTATLRDFQDGDLLAPTGDPRPGVTVFFDTDLGWFIGTSYGTTDAAGEVSVVMASDEEGVANVRAFVEADGVESRPARVTFGIPLSFQLNSVQDPYPYGEYDWYYFHVSCVDIEFYLDDELCFEYPFSGITSMALGPIRYNCPVEAGGVMRFSFAPLEGHTCQSDPEFIDDDHPQLWLHYWYGDDYAHQVTLLLSDMAHTPLLEPVEYEVTFEEIPYYGGSKSEQTDRRWW